MNPRVCSCAHLRAPDLAELIIEPAGIFVWHNGPIMAIAECPQCDGIGLLDMVDWDSHGRVRIYALSGLEREPLATYQRNTAKGSCDVARFQVETEALLSLAGPVERLIAVDVDAHRVLASVAPPAGFCVPSGAWQERLPSPDERQWFAILGIEK